MWFEKSISYGRNDCRVIDSGFFASNETIFICFSSFWGACSEESIGVSLSSSFTFVQDDIIFQVWTKLHVWTTFHELTQHNCSLLGHEHPPHHHTYFTVSITFSLYFEVTEKYFKADSSNPGEKSIMLSILSPHAWT